MKMREALGIMAGMGPNGTGYRVSFERVEGRLLAGDYFPERDEAPIEREEEAWQLAKAFAAKTTGTCVNICVVNAGDYTPVKGYRERMIENRLDPEDKWLSDTKRWFRSLGIGL